jgi:DNA-binding CsgD family transcriptional regulator
MCGLDHELLELGGDLTGALEEVQLPAALLDSEGAIRWQNNASRALRGDRVGSTWAEMAAPDEEPTVREAITRIVCHGEPAEFSLNVVNKNGDFTEVEISAVPVRDGGSVVGIFGLGHPSEPKVRHVSTTTHLTERQLEVLRLLGEGRSTDEIAFHLHLSATTVRNHVAALLSKLGVHTRLQAVIQASKTGLLDP